MATRRRESLNRVLEGMAQKTTSLVGSSWAFLGALSITLLWIGTGPIFHFSDTWQLVMNTVSSIVTFLMVFLLQRSQNKDSLAMQVKLNELIAATQGASNRLINIESLGEEDLNRLHDRYQQLHADRLSRGASTSIDQVRDSRASLPHPSVSGESG